MHAHLPVEHIKTDMYSTSPRLPVHNSNMQALTADIFSAFDEACHCTYAHFSPLAMGLVSAGPEFSVTVKRDFAI